MNNIQLILKVLSNNIEKHSFSWLKSNNYLISKGNDNGFEQLVNRELEIMSNNKKPISFKYNAQFGHHFPDLDIIINQNKYGVELKSKQDGTFKTVGNSIFESITEDNYSDIYIFFGSRNKKNNESYKCRFDKYRKSLEGVHVTHSPRFQISLDNSTPVFKNDNEYSKFRKENEVQKSHWVRKILAQTANKNKWYVSESLKTEDWKNLDTDTKDKIMADLIINFPIDIFKKKSGVYLRIAEYLSNEYFVTSANLRDVFTAGGTVQIKGITNTKFPHKIYTANLVKERILNYLNQSDETYIKQCLKNWKIQDQNIINLFDSKDSFNVKFKKILNSMSPTYKNSKNIQLYDLITEINSKSFILKH